MDRLTATCSTCDGDGICTGRCVSRGQMGNIYIETLIALAVVFVLCFIFVSVLEVLSFPYVLSVTQTDILELTLGSMAGFALVHVLSKFKIVRK